MANLQLFSYVTTHEARAAFTNQQPCRSYCDDQFIKCGDAVLFYARLKRSPGGTHFLSSDHLIWRPERDDYHADEEWPWLPSAVIPQFDNSSEYSKPRLYMFASTSEFADRWLYCGEVHLSSYGHADGKAQTLCGVEARFLLKAGRIPLPKWTELGGFPAWRVRARGKTIDLDTQETRQFQKIISGLPTDQTTHIEITRWQGDCLSVNLNASRGFPMYLPDPVDSGLYVFSPEEDCEKDENFNCNCCGLSLEIPRCATLPRDQALDVMLELFQTGAAPMSGDQVFPAQNLTSPTTWTKRVGRSE